MKKIVILLIFICSFGLFSASAQSLDFDVVTPHPRLLLTKGDVSKMRELPARSTNAKLVHEKIISLADGYLNAEPIKRELEGVRMLSVSREALKRIFYLSYAYVMTEDMRYVEAAEREMLAASAFEDWNPSHFLDVAEMTMALSIGYDWLYRRLSVHSRSIIGTAIYEKGLRASEGDGVNFWSAMNNWNQVCNAGMIYGALATLERSPEYCKQLIMKCLESNKKGQQIYEPDGAYPEGYSYWAYGSGFEVMLAAALESALSTDAGISAQKSFMQSAEFMNYMVAPSGKVFNYGDCHTKSVECEPAKYWFARKSGNASLVALDERELKSGKVVADRLLPLYMICATHLDLSSLQLPDKHVWQSKGGVPIYIYRSGWDSDDAYFAIKGGKATINHAHMDAGSFVYELDGVRWAVDLGAEDYTKLETSGVALWNMSQESTRWDVFRMSAAAHNTLTFNGARHNVDGKAEIVSSYEHSRERGVEMDLTPVFANQVKRVMRSAKLDKKNYLTITDKIENDERPTAVEWRMATYAKAEIVSPQEIMLTQDGKTIYLRLRSRAGAVAKIWDEDNIKPYEAKNEGLRRVGFIVEVKAGDSVDIEVSLSPVKSNVVSRIKQRVIR